MNRSTSFGIMAAALCAVGLVGGVTSAADIELAGTHVDVGPSLNGSSPLYVVVPWRTDRPENSFAVSSTPGLRYYGRHGYALFATNFSWPNAQAVGSNSNLNPVTPAAPFENLYDLPSWVTSTSILSTRLAGGFTYALIDDPREISGSRDFTWGYDQDPNSQTCCNGTQSAYIQLGLITGSAITTDPNGAPDRWSFTVGAGVPNEFRLGMMTDGYDNSPSSPAWVALRQDGGEYVGTGTLARNRDVDMTFFDIVGAQPGDTFIMSGEGSGRVAGFTFDVVPEPATLTLCGIAAIGATCLRRRRE